MLFKEMFELTGIRNKETKKTIQNFFDSPESFLFDYVQIEEELTKQQINKIKTLQNVVNQKIPYQLKDYSSDSLTLNVLASIFIKRFPELLHLQTEKFCVAYFSNETKVIAFDEFSFHSENSTPQNYQYIAKRLLMLSKAEAVAVLHNHPSGVTTPSVNDDRAIKQIRDAVNVVGYHFIDSLILGLNKKGLDVYSTEYLSHLEVAI